jgi:hypothetical protein
MTEYTYTISTVQAAVLCSDGKIYPAYVGRITHAPTGEYVWDSKTYTTEKAARLQAGRVRRNFEDFLAKHGDRWEVIVREGSAKHRAKRA